MAQNFAHPSGAGGVDPSDTAVNPVYQDQSQGYGYQGVPQQGYYPAAPQQGYYQQPPVPPVHTEPPNKGGKGPLWVIIAILAVLAVALAAGVFFLINQSKDDFDSVRSSDDSVSAPKHGHKSKGDADSESQSDSSNNAQQQAPAPAPAPAPPAARVPNPAPPAPAAPPPLPGGASYCGGAGAYSVYAGTTVTSCPFARSVFNALVDSGYGPGSVSAYSPVTGKTYVMSCYSEGGNNLRCQGGVNAEVIIRTS